MKLFNRVSTALPWVIVLATIGCGDTTLDPEETEQQALATVRSLLKIHGVLGKHPDERTEEDKKQPVDKGALSALILDLDAHDEFIANLYVGLVVGAAAREQDHLLASRQGKRATVTAGKMNIQLEQVDGKWKINLAKSIPTHYQKMAIEEQDRYNAARAAGADPS